MLEHHVEGQSREKNQDRKKVILLLGGVGAGKSRILNILRQRFDAKIIQADLVAKELEKKGNAGYHKLVAYFGEEILGADGEIDKGKLAELIFGDEQALMMVNQMIHPLVWREIVSWIAGFETGILVVESAIPDKKQDDIYEEVWYVYTQKEIRTQRLMESRGYSYEKCLSIFENQPREEEYRALADHVIDNSGTFEETLRQIHKLLES